jgi:hypothetical protein
MTRDPCPELRGRICPFISSGDTITRCQGVRCLACRPVRLEEGTVWVCALVDRDFADSWEQDVSIWQTAVGMG